MYQFMSDFILNILLTVKNIIHSIEILLLLKNVAGKYEIMQVRKHFLY